MQDLTTTWGNIHHAKISREFFFTYMEMHFMRWCICCSNTPIQTTHVLWHARILSWFHCFLCQTLEESFPFCNTLNFVLHARQRIPMKILLTELFPHIIFEYHLFMMSPKLVWGYVQILGRQPTLMLEITYGIDSHSILVIGLTKLFVLWLSQEICREGFRELVIKTNFAFICGPCGEVLMPTGASCKLCGGATFSNRRVLACWWSLPSCQ